jgi:stearoyl-CoA desaturase (delta-9 desaturase)
LTHVARTVARWFDSHAAADADAEDGANAQTVDWLRVIPFALLHLGCFAVIFVGWSPAAVAVAAALYFVRMFAVTGFYHRYFSHRTFRASRLAQAAFAVIGASAVQRGPLWWAAHHRHHHIHSDKPADVHSPRQHGFLWSHIGWITSRANFRSRLDRVPDLARFPELRFLDRFDTLVPFALAAALCVLGALLARVAPGLGTDGPQMLVWGFFISSTVLLHATLSINSLAHVIGKPRYPTGDDSKNSFALALLTLGEGWHNNHHHYPNATRQGFFWWEVDVTYYGLWVLERLGVIHELRPVPVAITSGAPRRTAAAIARAQLERVRVPELPEPAGVPLED